MVPKRIFFFWANKQMSWLRYQTLATVKKLNPTWRVQLYTSFPKNEQSLEKSWEDDVIQDFFNYTTNKNYFSSLSNLGIEIKPWNLDHPTESHPKWNNIGPSHKSNFFKWQQLGTEGGIYADMDILFIRPLTKLYDNLVNNGYTTGLCYTKHFSIGLLSSAPNNQFFQDLFLHSFKKYTPKRYQCVGVETLCDLLTDGNCWDENKQFNWNWLHGLDLLKYLKTKYPDQNIYNFPMHLVYPFKYDEMWKVFQRPITDALPSIKEDTIGIHWYAGDNTSQKYNNTMDMESYNAFDNSITYYVNDIFQKKEVIKPINNKISGRKSVRLRHVQNSRMIQDIGRPKIMETNNNISQSPSVCNQKLPKKMTFFWAGEKMSFLRFLTVYSFVKFNPDWETVVICSDSGANKKTWTCPNVADFISYSEIDYSYLLPKLKITIENKRLINPSDPNNPKWNELSPPHKCDFLEWETLAFKGGFFADFDILFTSSLNSFYDTVVHNGFDTSVCYHAVPGVNYRFFSIGFLFSSVCNLFYKDLYMWTFKYFDSRRYQGAGVFSYYSYLSDGKCTHKNSLFGNMIKRTDFLQQLKRKYPTLNVYNIPYHLVYPWSWNEIEEIFNKDNSAASAPDMLGIHWFGGSPIAQTFNSIVNHTNYNDFNNTLCKSINRVWNENSLEEIINGP